MTQATANLIDAMSAHKTPKRQVEQALVQQALGVVAALAAGEMTPAASREALFNLDTYEAIKRGRLSSKLAELFEWGMELPNVHRLTPDALPESYQAMRKLAFQILRTPEKPRRSARRSA